MQATNVLRATGAVVPVEDYRAVCDQRDSALAEVERLTLLLRDRSPDFVVIDDLTIDLRTGILSRNGDVFGKLTPVEAQIIRCLAADRGRPVALSDIDAFVWDQTEGYDDDGHRVRVNLCRIRSKLGDPPPTKNASINDGRYFRTYRNVGVALL